MELLERFEIDHFSPLPEYLQLGQKIFEAWFSGCLSQDFTAVQAECLSLLQVVPTETVEKALGLLAEVGLIDWPTG